MISEISDSRFLIAELIRRDFIKKYKRTTFGILWSALSPLLLLVTMDLVFGTFFGRNMPHYTIYLFCGLMLFNYFSNTTKGAMKVLQANAPIFSKVPVPKIYFIISHSVSMFIDFLISLTVLFVFVAIDGISFSFSLLALVIPTLCLYFINFGIGLVLATLFIFFRDISHFYPVLCRIIMYASAIFYDVSILPGALQRLLQCNPLYMCINYFRMVIIHTTVPDVFYHIVLIIMTAFCMLVGILIYRLCRDRIALYV